MRNLRTRLISVATLALALGALPYAAAQAGDGDRAGRPSLDRSMNGQAAIDALGDSLDEAAALNGWSTSQLRKTLKTDDTAWVSKSGRVFYKDPAAPAGADAAPDTGPAPFPLDQTFLLHSRPGSNRTIMLDFDGANVSGTYWNIEEGVPNGNYPAWTLDGDAATFNDAEREAIQSIWQRVAEDYAPFDVDVTTEEPGLAKIQRTDLSDQVYGTRALITPSTVAEGAICGTPVPSCGGVAYIDVFGLEDPDGTMTQPAWVFPQSLSNSTKNIAEATTHEVGHNLSLGHDGVTNVSFQSVPNCVTGNVTGYYCGHANWSPIMGVGYYKPIGQWSKGEYAGANNTAQDDVALIAARAPYIADEAGATTGTASPSLAGAKLITTAGDQDVFALGGCQGTLNATATPAPNSPNLDIQLDVLNASGGVVATNNPPSGTTSIDVASGLSAAVTTSLTPGFYYLRVDGVGNGTGTTGYTDYASIGGYSVSASGLSCGLNVPGAPTIGKAKSGKPGGKKTAKFKWSAPSSTGGVGLTGYTVQIIKKGKVVKTVQVAAGKTSYKFKTKKGGKYKAVVTASNALGAGAPSAASKAVKAK